MTDPIRLRDRLHTVLARDPRLFEVLLAASPSFSIFGNPLTRGTMARLATVEQAARVAGVDANALVAQLNAVLHGAPLEAPPATTPAAPRPAATDELPEAVRTRTEVACDVREELRAHREPLGLILEAARRLGDAEVLHLRALFEPAPLYAVLGRQGLEHFTRRDADDDWHVWFWRGSGTDGTTAKARPKAAEGDDLVVLDVRGLEPPEPMVRTLEALERLPRGRTLVQLNVRVPQFLLPQLAERGFAYEVREQSPDFVRIFIHHST